MSLPAWGFFRAFDLPDQYGVKKRQYAFPSAAYLWGWVGVWHSEPLPPGMVLPAANDNGDRDGYQG